MFCPHDRILGNSCTGSRPVAVYFPQHGTGGALESVGYKIQIDAAPKRYTWRKKSKESAPTHLYVYIIHIIWREISSAPSPRPATQVRPELPNHEVSGRTVGTVGTQGTTSSGRRSVWCLTWPAGEGSSWKRAHKIIGMNSGETIDLPSI